MSYTTKDRPVSLEERVNKHRTFVHTLVSMTAGGPPAEQLVHCIENGTLNYDAVGRMLAGLPISSYDQDHELAFALPSVTVTVDDATLT
jgi:hypothetical protein